jgi:4a-hydroxytetrahydrobiopterin dehydratase
MATSTPQPLKSRHCQACEGALPPVPPDEARRLIKEVPDWELAADGKRISRRWVVKDFAAGMEFLGRVAQLAEDEGHHPDLHLTGYRNVSLELWTHAIGGLSENDFILAAKINELPVATGTPGRSTSIAAPARRE